jgi:hypothetical protein
MMQVQNVKYTVTQDSVALMWGGKMVNVKKGAANFEGLKKAVLEGAKSGDWSEVPHHLGADSSLERWAKGKFKVTDGRISYNGEELPSDLSGRISEMASLGEDPTPLMKFWENLQANPSMRSVQQLWRFLANSGHPITADGHFLAYKSVRRDFRDIHSGTIENKPGTVIRMDRNKISDDPNETCHYGLHVGSLQYVEGFGGYDKRIVIVKVNPRDVVCVPVDYSSQKMRVCEYAVIGMHGEGQLPDTLIEDDEIPDLGYGLAEAVEEGGSAVHKPLPGGKKRLKEFKRLDALDEAQLMQESYDTLRNYASKGLEIVGASRIPGGKWALVKAIMNARY